ncbi:MAG: diguanylate cyclase [Lachnospiraceae bacterium]|nr:diguanylate cyclase [Lachnospiraceae bacterium]
MFEYSYYSDIADDLKNKLSLIILIVPFFVTVIVSFCLHGVDVTGFLLLIDYAIFCLMNIMLVRVFYISEHILMKQIDILTFQVEDMKEDNDELVAVKNRIEKVNEELNLQRVKLAQMNREVNQSNAELAIQAELLKNINGSLSKDIPAFLNYIIDSVIRIRHAEFCGIYIDKNVFFNKRPFNSASCVSNETIKDASEMKILYEKASNREDDWRVYRNLEEEDFPTIVKTNTHSIMVMPLVLDKKKYGVIVVGSRNPMAFEEHVTFYDVIVPQFNLAIHNFQLYNQMKHIAQTDGLTGINNRTHFNRLFNEQMDVTLRNNEPLTVALFDIDKFKRINDTYGHLVGDEVIKCIASLAYEYVEVPEKGFICRYGGEEFVLVFPNTNTDTALETVRALHKKIEDTTVEAYGHVVSMTVSIGVTNYPVICDDVNQLLKRADWSMYYAKEHGRNQIKVDGPDVTEVK